MIYYKFLKKVIQHKISVFYVGYKLKVSLLNLIVHDLSKIFSFQEFHNYSKKCFSTEKIDILKYKYAFNSHQKRNPHHWEYWVTIYNGNIEALPMPEWAVREMVANWYSTSKFYNGEKPNLDNWEWLNENFYKMILHRDTKNLIIDLIEELKQCGF